MEERDWLVEEFEAHRAHLRAVAYRMLGSLSEADDAVQEAWLRLSRSDTSDVENLGGWLTTVVGRVCLNMLRSRGSRREEPLAAHVPDPIVSRDDVFDPEHDALFAAARAGDFEALVAVLDPDVVARTDGGPGASVVVRGASTLASRAVAFAQPAAVVRPVLVNGAAGVVVSVDGRPVSVMGFTVTDGRIVAVDILSDPERIRRLDLSALDQ